MSDSQPINCVECQSQLVEFALDELPERLRASIEEHLANGCAACNEQLVEVLGGLAKLAFALPMDRPAARVEQALFERIAEQRGKVPERAASGLAGVRVASKAPTRQLVTAMLVLAATVVGVALWSNWNRRSNRGSDVPNEWAAVQRRVERANASEHFAAIPELKFASLRTPAVDSAVHGYIVVDPLAKQWHVYSFHLPALAAGREYQLWFDLGDSHFVRAGGAKSDDEGTLASVIDVPSDVVDAKGLAISDESEAAPDRPTGEILIEAPLR